MSRKQCLENRWYINEAMLDIFCPVNFTRDFWSVVKLLLACWKNIFQSCNGTWRNIFQREKKPNGLEIQPSLSLRIKLSTFQKTISTPQVLSMVGRPLSIREQSAVKKLSPWLQSPRSIWIHWTEYLMEPPEHAAISDVLWELGFSNLM